MVEVPRLHNELLDVLPVLPPEVQHPRDAAVVGEHERIVLLRVLLANAPGEKDALADGLPLPEVRQEAPVPRGHGMLEAEQRLAQLRGRCLDAQGRVNAGQQGAHGARGPGERHLRGALIALEEQLPGLDEGPEDLIENVLVALCHPVVGALVHDGQACADHPPESLFEADQTLQELAIVVRLACSYDRRNCVCCLRLYDHVGLEEPLLVQQARHPEDAPDVRRGYRAVGVDARPVVEHRAGVVDHRRPPQPLAQRQQGPRDEAGQRLWSGAGRPTWPAAHVPVLAVADTSAIVQCRAAPVTDHDVADNREGPFQQVLRHELEGALVATSAHAGLQVRIAVQVSSEIAGDGHAGQHGGQLGEDFEGRAVERLYANGISAGQEAVLVDLPQAAAAADVHFEEAAAGR
mmetsp:Transcript_87500/g.274022  ORF Transcript_87500/g.274022 Transcript_87500/m.274022 type:complete len:406 (+) Transcript_87500:1438-2655(+)